MMQKLKQIKFINSKISPFIAIFLISLFSLHEIFNMYFFRDDFTLLYLLEHNTAFSYPYVYEVIRFIPIYNIFGLNPFGYFAFGFLFFLISAFLFYFFVHLLFSNKILAFIATIIYTTSPLGIDSDVQVTLLQVTFFAISFLLIILILLHNFYKKGQIRYFIFSILFLLISFEQIPFRSFFFPGIMILFGLVFFKRDNISIKKFFFLQFIIVAIWLSFFIIRPNLSSRPAHAGQNSTIIKIFSEMDAKNLIINPITSSMISMYPLPNMQLQPFIQFPLFIFTFLFSVFFLKKYWRKENNLCRIYLFACLFIYLEILAFYPTNLSRMTDARDHYLTYNLPAYSLFILCLYLFLSKFLEKQKSLFHKLPLQFLFLIIAVNYITTQMYLQTFNQRITYVRPFFTQIKTYMPKILPNSLIYFELPPLSEGPDAVSLLYDIYAVGMYGPNAVFAALYNMNLEQIEVTKEWSETISFAKKNPKNIERVYGFRYDLNGLHNKIGETRELLRKEVKN